MITPDLTIAESFWSAFSPSDPTIRLRFIGNNYRNGAIEHEYPSLAEAWPDVCDKQRDGWNVFYVVNRADTPTRRIVNPATGKVEHKQVAAADTDIQRIRAYFIDCDQGIPEQWEWHVDPDFIVRTSKVGDIEKGQLIWLVDHQQRLMSALDTAYPKIFKEEEQRLVRLYKADPAAVNASRVLRLPGSLHLKDPSNPQLVTFDRVHASTLRRPAEILHGLPELPPAPEPGEKQSSPVAIERLEELLSWIDPDCGYAGWRDILFALRSTRLDTSIPAALALQFPGLVTGEDERLRALALRWSKGELERRGKYRDGPPLAYYDKDGGPCDEFLDKIFEDADPEREDGVGFGTIVHAAKVAGWEPPQKVVEPEDPNAWPPKHAKGQGRHRFISLSDYQKAPQPTFWDAPHNTLPKKADGTTILLWGLWGSHKSGLTASMALGLVKRTEDAVVAFCCGEGALDMGKTRMPAILQLNGTSIEVIEERYYVFPSVPRLKEEKDLADFIATLKMAPHIPNILVLDTMATMTPGISENDAGEFGGLFTDSGPIGELKRAFPGVLIVILHHPGKNEERGARGSSALYGNFDGIFHLTFDKKTLLIELEIEKLKVGRDGFSTYWLVNHSPEGIPVPLQIDETRHAQLGGKVVTAGSMATKLRGAIRKFMEDTRATIAATEDAFAEKHGLDVPEDYQRDLRFTDYEHGMTDLELAVTMLADMGVPPIEEVVKGHPNYTAYSEYVLAKGEIRRQLKDARRGEAAASLGSLEKVPTTKGAAAKDVWHWYLDAGKATTAPKAPAEADSIMGRFERVVMATEG